MNQAERTDCSIWHVESVMIRVTCVHVISFGLKIQRRKNNNSNNKKHHRQQRFSCVITNYGSLHTSHAISGWWSKWCIFYAVLPSNISELMRSREHSEAQAKAKSFWLITELVDVEFHHAKMHFQSNFIFRRKKHIEMGWPFFAEKKI